MPVTRCFPAVAALSLACAALTRDAKIQTPKKGIPVLQMDSVTYDGTELNARVLVGARDGPIVLDRRFFMDVRDVWDCVSGAPTGYVIEDIIWTEDADLVGVAPGQWIGANQSFWLFSDDWGEPRPDCVRVRFAVYLDPLGSDEHETLVIEARRTPPPGQPDAGDPPGAGDAGLPPEPPPPEPDRPDAG